MSDLRHRIRLLLVDDSTFFLEALRRELSKDRRFEVVALATNPYEARDQIMLFDPDVMISDINMPRMNGVDFIKKLMAQYPIPIIVISSNPEYIVDAIKVGALDGVEKPQPTGNWDFDSFVRELAEKIEPAAARAGRGGAGVGVGAGGGAGAPRRQPVPGRAETQRARPGAPRRGADRLSGGSRAGGGQASGPAGIGAAGQAGTAAAKSSAETPVREPASPRKRTDIALIAIGASTGGTDAIAKVVSELPSGLPGIVIVQHMPADFTGMFAQRLNRICHFPVSEAQNGDRIAPNSALVAPGNFQFRVIKGPEGYSVQIKAGEKVSGHCPSVDVLFSSVAQSAGPRAIGIILTGMGQDGANGLLEMRRAGAKTIGQDEKSCVVYGMPKVAYDIGAVAQQITLAQIATRIVQAL